MACLEREAVKVTVVVSGEHAMTLFKGTLLGAAAVAAVALAGMTAASDSADAAVCRARISGQGTGIGVAGLGTQNARSAALANWSAAARARFGARFANPSNARSLRYDCRSGFVLEVKCVVSGRPCR
jgi:hypothetical protein